MAAFFTNKRCRSVSFRYARTNASALTDDPLLPTEFRGIIDASLLINKVRAAVASGSAKQGGVN